MDGKALLKALMEAAGENPNSLANKLKKRSLQSQIQRFLGETTKEPRRTTLAAVAEHYGVKLDALYDADLAQQVAQARGFMPPPTIGSLADGVEPNTHRVADERAPWVRRDTQSMDLGATAERLGALLQGLDPLAREPVAGALRSLIDKPSEAPYYADLIRAMMTVKQNRAA